MNQEAQTSQISANCVVRRPCRAVLVFVLVALALMVALTLPSLASATPGTQIPGQVFCLDNTGYQTNMVGLAPAVKAANTTNYVDHQWVYWTMRIYQDTGVGFNPVTDWMPWWHAYAADNAYTTTYYDTNGALQNSNWPGTGWSHTVTNSGNYDEIYNQVYFYANGHWDGPYYFWSTPSSYSANILGKGAC